jgi:hypothetical protein
MKTRAKFTQPDIARSIRAAKQAGAGSVELRPDGTILINIGGESNAVPAKPEQEVVL